MKCSVSVLMPVYNAELYLDQAITSILNQTFRDFEFIIIDDGSTDNSLAIMRKHAQRDRRLRIFSHEHKGLVSTLNQGLLYAMAPLIARMDADDISLPNRFERQVEYLRNNSKVKVLGGAVMYINAEGHNMYPVHYPTECKLDLQNRCCIAHSAVMMYKEFILGIGGYRVAYRHAEDYDLWLRAQEQGGVENLKDILLLCRKHTRSVSEVHCAQQMLAATFARLSAGLRRKGIKDITDTFNKLTISTLKKLPLTPAEYHLTYCELLSLKLLVSNNLTAEDVAIKIDHIIKKNNMHGAKVAHIYMRVARTYMINKRYCRFLLSAISAAKSHPVYCLLLLIRKLGCCVRFLQYKVVSLVSKR